MSVEYYTDRLKTMIGGKVVGVAEDEGYFGLVVQMPKKRVVVWFLSDDEGNDHGSFEMDDC